MKSEDQTRSLFGISLSDRLKWQQCLICSSGFFFGYFANGICEEYIYNRLQFSYGWYFTFVRGFAYLFLVYLQGFTKKELHPYIYGVLVFEAMATFIGQVSVLSLFAIFGAATTAMITTARKAATLLLSYLIFTKPLTEQHGTWLLLISMGIILKMVPDAKPWSKKPCIMFWL